MEARTCQNCKNSFTIEPEDFAFYEKIKVPPPTWCPQCRFVRRLVMRNERSLYKRKCDLCGMEKILIFPRDSKFKVYCFDCWWSDRWSASEYALDYDFSRPFFEQFHKLYLAVPRLGIIQQGFQKDSEYTNRASDNKNCYLIFASANNENCAFGTSIWGSKECLDGYELHGCEKCYECVNCYSSSDLKYCQECTNCMNSAFLLNCRNCTDCFGCVNLRNQQYCLWNEQYTKEEYFKLVRQIDLRDRRVVADLRKKLEQLIARHIVPALVEYKTYQSSGNWLEECRNVKESFNVTGTEEGKYLFGINEAKDVMDYTYWGKGSELIYFSSSIGRQCVNCYFCNESWDQLIRAQYCMNCHSSSDLFGCVGMRKSQFCILNKQYSKEEFMAILPRILDSMRDLPFVDKEGRKYGYGDFFPPETSPAPYNETIAQEYFPITEEEARTQGYHWSHSEKKGYTISLRASDLPPALQDVPNSMEDQIVECLHRQECTEQCTGAYKLTAFELEFYRRLGVPLPQLCPNCRHYARIKLRPSLQLTNLECMCRGLVSRDGRYSNTAPHFHGSEPCPNQFKTAYPADRIIYCLQCYNSEVA